jgi:ribosomal protein L11 methyltransferase
MSGTFGTPDRWLVLTVKGLHGSPEGSSAPDPSRELIPELLLELGGRGVEEDPEGFTTYLAPPDDLDTFLSDAKGRLEKVAPGRARLEWAWQPHEDWEDLWRQGLGPRRITPRIVVAPTWDTPEAEPGEILITLDPGMAFGTAEHATTRGCLRLLDGRVREGDRIADIGSGSGILSIAAAHLGAKQVLGIEVDPMACEAARENLQANSVEDRVRIVVDEIQGSEPIPEAPYQGIVANMQRFILVPLLPSFKASLDGDAWMILSGILLEEREDLLQATTEAGFRLDAEDQEDEWWSGVFFLS